MDNELHPSASVPPSQSAQSTKTPKGVRVSNSPEGGILLSLPVNSSRMFSVFILVFGILPIVAGTLIWRTGDSGGLFPGAIGILFLILGLYLLLGRIELSLEANHLTWTRIFFKRWKSHQLDKQSIQRILTDVTLRTNGHPTGWSIVLLFDQHENDSPSNSSSDENELGSGENESLREKFLRQQKSQNHRKRLPGSFAEERALWLGIILSKWSEKPFDDALDKERAAPKRRRK